MTMNAQSRHPERLDALADQIKSDNLDAVLITTPANLYYFCGFRTTLYPRFNGLLCTASGGSVLVTSYIDEQLAKKGIWGPVWAQDIRIHGPLDRSDVYEEPLTALSAELREIGTLGVDDISYALFCELQRYDPNLNIVNVTGSIMRLRMAKDPEEQARIAEASRIACACMEKGREVLGRGNVSEHELGAELEYHARMAGADGFGYPILISTGEKITAPHAPPLQNAIPADAPFVRVAFAPIYDGYTTSLIRTFSPAPSPTMQRFEQAFLRALDDIEAMLRPGVSVQDVLRTVDQSYRASGVREFWGGDMGYSVGVSVHEPPRIGGRDDTRIEAGMVLALMPGLRQPDKATFHHSEVYAVTDDGCHCLSNGLRHLLQYD